MVTEDSHGLKCVLKILRKIHDDREIKASCGNMMQFFMLQHVATSLKLYLRLWPPLPSWLLMAWSTIYFFVRLPLTLMWSSMFSDLACKIPSSLCIFVSVLSLLTKTIAFSILCTKTFLCNWENLFLSYENKSEYCYLLTTRIGGQKGTNEVPITLISQYF